MLTTANGGLGGPEEDHQLHHCCWTGRVGEREEEEEEDCKWGLGGPEEDHQLHHCCWTGREGKREEEDDCKLNVIYSDAITRFPLIQIVCEYAYLYMI